MTNFDYFYNDLWSKTLSAVSASGQVDDAVFEEFFSSTKLINIDIQLQTALVCANSVLGRSILLQYQDVIESCLEMNNNGNHLKLNVVLKDNLKEIIPPTIQNEFFSKDLNLDQDFSSFVVGKSNMQAQIASLTCSKNLGLMYNPLFIYGNSGLGKTHLLNAIGNEVRTSFPNTKIGLITGLEFIDGLQNAKKDNRIDDFKDSFKDLDLLLIDDIQFIAGKSWTQEIFFSIFTNLVNNRKQICITADKSPSDIKGLEERLLSRFNQGLNVNIQSPEYETSIEILKRKIKNNISVNEKIDDEVLSFIATNYSKDVRSLEGAINRLLFYYINFRSTEDDHITLKLAYEAFADDNNETRNDLNIAKIRKTVCDYYNITKQQIISPNRTKNIATPRQIAMYLCRKLIDAPYKEIGNEFGKRDHSTVISSIEKVENLIKTDSNYLTAINEIERRIK